MGCNVKGRVDVRTCSGLVSCTTNGKSSSIPPLLLLLLPTIDGGGPNDPVDDDDVDGCDIPPAAAAAAVAAAVAAVFIISITAPIDTDILCSYNTIQYRYLGILGNRIHNFCFFFF